LLSRSTAITATDGGEVEFSDDAVDPVGESELDRAIRELEGLDRKTNSAIRL
jgi:hypothetical protein